MNILYYVPDLTQANGGVRQYACALLKILAQDAGNTYYVLHNVGDPIILSIIAASPNLNLIPPVIGRHRNTDRVLRYAWILTNQVLIKTNSGRRVPVLGHVERLCTRYSIDLVYCPYQYLPETTRKNIVTLHDVQEIHFPEFFTPAQRLERAQVHKQIAEESTLIVVSYEHVKQDLITYFGRTTENVLVCLLAMRNLWFERFFPANVVSLDSYNLPESFLFYPAVTWPHKNHLGLLKAVALLRDQRQTTIQLVFTGHQTDYAGRIRETIEQLGLESQVQFLGVVAEDVLYALYQAARAVVVPTLYEAGSFPLMESILLGRPVICSAVTSLPDTIGDKRYVFDPINTADMADKISRICFNEDYRRENIENSHRQAVRLRNTGALTKLTKAISGLGLT